jgi:Lrp/AsnC family leucine-responsive transcriptional regulator
MIVVDELDYKVLYVLQRNGRITWSELAKELGLSNPATAERVRRLEEQGLINGYTALIDPFRVGCELTAFVGVTLERPEHRAPFLKCIGQLEEIQECHHVAGDDDYLLKIRCRNTRDLDRIISQEIKGLSGIVRTRTTIVMDTCKETPVVPLLLNKFSG